MADEHKTDGSGSTVTPPGTSTVQQTTQTPGDSGDRSGLEGRIHGLTAEKKRLAESNAELQKQYDELAEKVKSDQERAIDQARREAVDDFKKTEHEPLTTRATAQDARLKSEVTRMRQGLPPEVFPPDFDGQDTMQQFDFLRGITVAKGQPAPSVGTPANPQSEPAKRIIPGTEFRKWQGANMYDAQDRAKWEEQKEEMNTAYREGRIDWNT